MRRTAVLRNSLFERFNVVDKSVKRALDEAYQREADANETEPAIVATPAERVARTPELADVFLTINTPTTSEEILVKPTGGQPIGLTDLFQHPTPKETLIKIYDHTLALLADKFPATSMYRTSAENLTRARKAAVEEGGDISDIEQRVGSGLVEEIIIQAAEEFRLAEELAEHKVWEDLKEPPVPGQWTAFAFADQPQGQR